MELERWWLFEQFLRLSYVVLVYQEYIYGGQLVADSAAERHLAAKKGPCPQRPEIS